MKPEIKEKWVAALRSGEYQQTTEVLHDDNGFCCLGVLTELYRQEHGGEWEKISDSSTIYKFVNKFYLDGCETEILPWTVVHWSGLNDQVPHLADNYISNLNDSGMSFAKIADLIEEQL